MEEKTYRVQEIFEWFKQFDKEEIKIVGESKKFEIFLNKRSIPHLLGLQYLQAKNEEKMKARELFNLIKNENLSDREIYKIIEEKHNDEKILNDVKNRIETFQDFMENIENGIIVEQTHSKTEIKSNYFIVLIKEELIHHLGIKQDDLEDSIVEYSVFKKGNNSGTYLETYFVRNDENYFRDSKIKEEVRALYRYNEEIEEYEEFTFKRNYENNMINKKKKNQDKDLER